MATHKKFHGRRDYKQGQMMVQTGSRGREDPMFKVFLPGMNAVILTLEQADDLCDLLADALEDEDPTDD